jgi:hypothetical protein
MAWAVQRTRRMRRAMFLFLSALLGCGTEQQQAELGDDSAEITVTTSAGDTTHRWSAAGGNFVHCNDAAHTLFVRLAMSAERDGEDALHADFDVCGFAGTPEQFAGSDPYTTLCQPGVSFFDVFWHEANQASVRANNAASTDCSLDLAPEVGVLAGTFRCRGLALFAQPASLDIRGAFRCSLP